MKRKLKRRNKVKMTQEFKSWRLTLKSINTELFEGFKRPYVLRRFLKGRATEGFVLVYTLKKYGITTK